MWLWMELFASTNRYSKIRAKKERCHLSITDKWQNHLTFKINTNYIAFEVCPNQLIKYNPIVKIDVIDGVYDLSNRETKN